MRLRLVRVCRYSPKVRAGLGEKSRYFRSERSSTGGGVVGGVSESVGFREVGGEGWGVKSSEYEESAGTASRRCWMGSRRLRSASEFSADARLLPGGGRRAALKR